MLRVGLGGKSMKPIWLASRQVCIYEVSSGLVFRGCVFSAVLLFTRCVGCSIVFMRSTGFTFIDLGPHSKYADLQSLHPPSHASENTQSCKSCSPRLHKILPVLCIVLGNEEQLLPKNLIKQHRKPGGDPVLSQTSSLRNRLRTP